MKVFTDIHLWRQFRAENSCFQQSVGFVPTMGNLHAGHATVLQRCAEQNPIRVLSIFVNPMQFSQPDDLLSYPRTLEQDLDLARENDVSFVITPLQEQIYPHGIDTKVTHSSPLAAHLEGKHRPGHFDGVLTVVAKLLGLVQPDHSYFGEKDFQQLLLVQQLLQDLFLPGTIVSVPTVREDSGLALSSRNTRLSPESRKKAPLLFALLRQMDLSCLQIQQNLVDQGFQVDYVYEQWNRRLAAVHLDGVRLIDNVSLL